jgi:hypothetical protein
MAEIRTTAIIRFWTPVLTVIEKAMPRYKDKRKQLLAKDARK